LLRLILVEHSAHRSHKSSRLLRHRDLAAVPQDETVLRELVEREKLHGEALSARAVRLADIGNVDLEVALSRSMMRPRNRSSAVTAHPRTVAGRPAMIASR